MATFCLVDGMKKVWGEIVEGRGNWGAVIRGDIREDLVLYY